ETIKKSILVKLISLKHFWVIAGSEVCFERLGCFSDESPWGGTLQRPFKTLPWSPEEVNTRFLLYTNENPNNFQEITADLSTIESSNFKTGRKTRFIIHGFIDDGEESWLSDICQNLFTVESVNCICVDWSGGSRTAYSQASQNIRIVGAEVAYLVGVLQSSFSYSPSNVHVIGHSLGAHAAGEAGRRTNGTIGRITGWSKHLRPPNSLFNALDKLVTFGLNQCFPCPSEGCPQMGHYADRFRGRTSAEGQVFYLNTGDASNFARWRYKVNVTLSGKKVTGHVLVSLFGDKGNSRQYDIFKGTLKPDETVSNEFDSDVEVGDLQKVKFLWYNNVINLTLPKVGASKITVERNDGAV
ncbi:hypothetical protein HPG69_015326, partial [Diceros bicornis minor]